MEDITGKILEMDHVSFTYPGSDRPSIQNISTSLLEGDFAVLFGRSGSGKSTLLRQIKTALTPHGEQSGKVLFGGKQVKEMSDQDQAWEIGYVLQNPDTQIVTNKVSSELAFGLENMGIEREEMIRRIGEMVAYFGMSDWYHKEIYQLSGGQKQMLNLAAIMVMHPKMLILDEPTAWLDPISACDFIDMIVRLNREMGITVLLSEQRLNKVIPVANKLLYMRQGRMEEQGTVLNVMEELFGNCQGMDQAFPISAQAYFSSGRDQNEECPLTVADGRRWLSAGKPYVWESEKVTPKQQKCVLSCKNIYFRYERNAKNVLEQCDCSLEAGKVYVLLGSNGSGKSTLLSLICGQRKPLRGKVLTKEKIVMLPQNVRHVFCKDTVEEEINSESLQQYGLDSKAKCHPFDLSGGEMALVALAKLWEKDAGIYLLDEPTKGLDICYKYNLAEELRKKAAEGKTVVVVSHDIDFCSQVADHVLMMFDGKIIYSGDPVDFFQTNFFYTTEAAQLTRGIVNGIVTRQDVIRLCQKK